MTGFSKFGAGGFGAAVAGVLVAAVCLAGVAQAEETKSADKKSEPSNRYAVRTFVAKGVDANVAGVVETSFCNALSSRGLDVLCPGDVHALLTQKHAQLELGACDQKEESCLKGIAEVSKASRIVTGEVSKVGDVFQVSVSVVDPAQQRVVTRASERANRVEKLLEVVGVVAGKISGAL